VTFWFYFNGKNVKVTIMVKVTVKSKGNSKGKGKVTVNTFIISQQPDCSVKFYKPNQLQWADERTAKFLASVWMIAICDLRFAYLKLLKPKLKFRSTVWPPLLDLDPNPFLSGSGSRKSESIPVLIMIQIKDANIYGSAWIRIWNTANRLPNFFRVRDGHFHL